MKKVVLMLVLLIVARSVSATNVEVAKSFMAAGMYPQAIALLEQEIYGDKDKGFRANPRNVEAHFQLGICFVHQLRFTEADKCFKSTVQLNSGQYGNRISQVYSSVGSKFLAQNDSKSAKNLFDKAVEYNPGLRLIIADGIFQQGKIFLHQRQNSLANDAFKIASGLNSSLNQKVMTLYLDLGDSADDIECLPFYTLAAEWGGRWSDRADTVGERLKNIAQGLNQKNIFNPNIEQYWELARQFIQLPPYHQELEVGIHWFRNLQPGSIIVPWLYPPSGQSVMMSIGDIVDARQFDVFLKNGVICKSPELKNRDLEQGFKLRVLPKIPVPSLTICIEIEQ